MNYPLNLLKRKLEEAKEAQVWCIECYNKEDYQKIEEEIVIPIQATIRLIDMAVSNNLIFEYPDE